MALETTAAEDLNSVAQWTQYLQERAPLPQLRSARSDSPPSFKLVSAPSILPPDVPRNTSPTTAQTIADFYDQSGFLPPPRADEETLRRQAIQEYHLFRADQLENFHRASSLVNSFFHFAPVCTISLFHNDTQVVVSKAGAFPRPSGGPPATPSPEINVEAKPDTDGGEHAPPDGHWRFTGNTLDSTGVRGYVGVPLTLETDPSNPLDATRVTVGAVALMSHRPFLALSDTQMQVLDDLATLLAVQLRSTWERWQRGKETRLRNAVSMFLERALVEPSQQALMDAAGVEPTVQGAPDVASTARAGGKEGSSTKALFSSAARELQTLLEADFAVIVDLTAFHATPLSPRRQRSHSWVADGSDSAARLSKGILGSSASAAYAGQDVRFNAPEAMGAIAAFLDGYVANGRSVFSGCDIFSGLESLLQPSFPASAAASSAPSSPANSLGGKEPGPIPIPHLVLPFYSSQRPNLLVIVASATPFVSFKPADVTFASNVGVILVARLAQNAIVEADKAKTAFVSQISHELRTPLHGLLGQLHLVRDTITSGELAVLPSLLDAAEFCGAALRDIVDDILEFGKSAQAGRDGHSVGRPRHVLVDLAQLTVETSRSCWLRRVQWQSIAAEENGPPPVGLAVEYEDRTALKNWWISLDLSGFMRILNTLVTNSLKFTSKGLITISLAAGRGSEDSNDRFITLRVEDTGLGIAPEFVDRLFDPFTQADLFSPGAGLGLHICKSVVDRMRGTITVEPRSGGGSIFTVVLPVDDLELAPAGTPQVMHRTLISADPIPAAKTASWPPTYAASSASLAVARRTKLALNGKEPTAHDGLHLHILIVDDNAISRKILIRMVKNSNVTTYEAEDGMYALEIYREVHPQVVWTDISMPRMDGVTAAREMRQIEREDRLTPAHIVAITGLGLSDEYIRREALLGPAALNGWLIKGQTNLSSLKETLVFVRQRLSAAC
ncbi:hypothetical protein DFH06DRAFT_1169852 [Mycena polygramma]|nr:hypothetical protein DFH06DRAFT_1169852 [Mycena polygramma]